MGIYSVTLKSTYTVSADDEMQAQLAACGVAAGCQSADDVIGVERNLMGCCVKPEDSDVLDTVRRPTFSELDEAS